MLEVLPVVRHMLLCDDVQVRPKDPHKLNILGLTSSIKSAGVETQSRRLVMLSVFLQVTELYRGGLGRIDVLDGDTAQVVYVGEEHEIVRPSSPLNIVPLLFRIGPLSFDMPSLFLVEFLFDNNPLAQEPLIVR